MGVHCGLRIRDWTRIWRTLMMMAGTSPQMASGLPPDKHELGDRVMQDERGTYVIAVTETKTLNDTSPLVGSVSPHMTRPEFVESRIHSNSIALQGDAKGNEAGTSNENPGVDLQNGVLRAYFHRPAAVRMLTGYLDDLENLNTRLLDDRIKTPSEDSEMVRNRLESFRKALRDMVHIDKREPNGRLTVDERAIVLRMLMDYEVALRPDSSEGEALDGTNDARRVTASRRIDDVGGDIPVSPRASTLDTITTSMNCLGLKGKSRGGHGDLTGTEPQILNESPEAIGLQNEPVWGNYHRGDAVRRLTEHLKDLEGSYAQFSDGVLETPPDFPKSMQKTLGCFWTALKDLADADKREPDSQLTGDEKVIVRRMLQSYQYAMEDLFEVQLKDHEIILSSMRLDGMVPLLLGAIDSFEGCDMVDFETKFASMMRISDAELNRCQARLEELSSTDLLDQVEVCRDQCTHLVTTLSSHTRNNLPFYHQTLQRIRRMKYQNLGIAAQQDRFRILSLCIRSLVELDRTLRLTVQQVSTCGNPEWLKTALEMSNAPPNQRIPRWSTFTVTLRQCEWASNVVEVSFHVLKQLLNSTVDSYYSKDAVNFKWNDEEHRMVLEFLADSAGVDGFVNKDETGSFKVAQDLEAKDRSSLLERVRLLMTRLPSSDTQHRIAKFLEKKLTGPVPHASYLPNHWFSVDQSELTFQNLIGVGSEGMVAEYEWLGKTVAVKSVRVQGDSRQKFEAEAAVLATVQHPNVVRLLGVAFREEKHVTGMLVMELMEYDLRSLIDERMKHHPQPFPLIVAIDIMIQIAEALYYLREHRVLHRDLRAKNIIANSYKLAPRGPQSLAAPFPDLAQLLCVEEYYIVKLADFGLAKCLPITSDCSTLNTGATLWRAPEVWDDVVGTKTCKEYRWPADIYSFGMTGYEILTGGIPFKGRPFDKLYDSIMEGVRPSLEGKAPPRLAQLIEKCWDTRQENRPTISQVIKELWCCKAELVFRPIKLGRHLW